MKYINFKNVDQQTCLIITFWGLCCTDDLLEEENDCWFEIVEDLICVFTVGAGNIFVGDFIVLLGTIVILEGWELDDCTNLFTIIPFNKNKNKLIISNKSFY